MESRANPRDLGKRGVIFGGIRFRTSEIFYFVLESKAVQKVGEGQKLHSDNYFLFLIESYYILIVDSTMIYGYKLIVEPEYYWCFSISLSSFFYFLSCYEDECL